MMTFFGTSDEFRDLFREGGCARHETVLVPQTSGRCMHYGPYGCEVPRDDGMCPHLDNPDVLCPVKDACYAMCEEPAKACAIDEIEEVGA